MKRRKLPSDLFEVLGRDPDFKLAMCATGLKETGNPYYAWLAILTCIGHDKVYPEWVIAYLYQCSERMISDKAQKSKDLGRILPWVFDFPNKRGPGRLLNPDLGGSPDRRLFPMRFADLLFPLRFAIRIAEGEEPAEAMRNACNDAFDKKTADKVDDKTLRRWLLKDFGLKERPASAQEWKIITRQYYERSVGSLLDHYERTKSRETLG
jgi:hypothetical protein